MTSSGPQRLDVTVADGVGVITLNRPQAANAIDTQLGRELLAAFTEAAHRPEARCWILTGAGRFFCAGGDLKERDTLSDAQWTAQHRIFEDMMEALLSCPAPVIAAVNGAAYAGGCELALACDFIYAAPEAKFALTEVTLGFIPGVGGTQALPRAVGERRAKELLLTGQPFSAAEGERWGLVNRVVERGGLMALARQTAAAIASFSPEAAQAAKRVVHAGLQTDLRSGMALELAAYNELIGSDARRASVRRFVDERKSPQDGPARGVSQGNGE